MPHRAHPSLDRASGEIRRNGSSASGMRGILWLLVATQTSETTYPRSSTATLTSARTSTPSPR